MRYRTNDFTYEALGELLVANPTGIWWSAMNWFPCSSISTGMSKRLRGVLSVGLGRITALHVRSYPSRPSAHRGGLSFPFWATPSRAGSRICAPGKR